MHTMTSDTPSLEDYVLVETEYRGIRFCLMTDPEHEHYLLVTHPEDSWECWIDRCRCDSPDGNLIRQLLDTVHHDKQALILDLILSATTTSYRRGRQRGAEEARAAAQGHLEFVFGPLTRAIRESGCSE